MNRSRGDMDYEGPAVTDYGTLIELTEAQQDGDFTDRDFPVHTPKQDLTFSS
jgi:hypothetical protein